MNKLIKSESVLAIALGLILGVGEQSASAASPIMWGENRTKRWSNWEGDGFS